MRIDTDAIDQFAAETLAATRLPGAAIAIVHGGEIALTKGYGLRDIERRRPMLSNTLYPIASTSKPLNATLLATLVDEGRLAWDDRVARYLPEFALSGTSASAEVSIRDLLSMRTGLPRHDWLWLSAAFDRTSIPSRIRHLDLSQGFRQSFQYCNLSSTLAGIVAERLTGESWEALVDARILQPLGMTQTRFGPPSEDRIVTAYHETHGRELRATHPWHGSRTTAPAGGWVYSTIEDMSRWLCFNLGHVDGGASKILTAERAEELRSGQMVIGREIDGLGFNASYGLGWIIDTHRGYRRYSHGGYLDDVQSDIHLYPELDLGILTVTNFGPPRLAGAINETILGLVQGLSPWDAIGQRLRAYESAIVARRDVNRRATRVEGTRPSHPIESYAGSFTHPAYGDLSVEACHNQLTLERHDIRIALHHWHFDAFVGADLDRFGIHSPNPFEPANPVLFETDENGEVSAVLIAFEPATARIRFARAPS